MKDELLEVQTQLSYQDDSLQQLNDVVTRQQGEIDSLRREVDFLKDKLRELITNLREADADNVPPPHY
ncbi:SlyX family protein [Parendozoicomonas haliclonae]|uniref:Protein SlyX homolog n=1 Tax=Parendozoicomonas haliclonae TaxID=1960125 RepID=A0A1X7APG7_9GAMM|nr:SlyX family protein [Parendozoicomonas haliclonae]SMA49979.1 hypothetical protein EHSB41UT_03770 [Parendozoicomonas haliclonae]